MKGVQRRAGTGRGGMRIVLQEVEHGWQVVELPSLEDVEGSGHEHED